MPLPFDIIRHTNVTVLEKYLNSLAEAMRTNDLLARFGLRLDGLKGKDGFRMPLKVNPFDRQRDWQEVKERERLRRGKDDSRNQGKDDEGSDIPGKQRLYAFRGTLEDRPEAQPRELDSLVGEPGRALLILLGDPGSGKSEWLKLQARQEAEKERANLEMRKKALGDITVPFFLRLDYIAKLLADSDGSSRFWAFLGKNKIDTTMPTSAMKFAAALLRAAMEHYGFPDQLVPLVWKSWFIHGANVAEADSGVTSVTANGSTGNTRTVTNSLEMNGGRCLICLDALDEVRTNRTNLLGDLHAFLKWVKEKGRNRFQVRVSSRILGYAEYSEWKEDEWRIMPFQPREREKFISGILADYPDIASKLTEELRKKPQVEAMASNPLMVTLLAISFRPDDSGEPLSLPVHRVDVYEKILEKLLTKPLGRESAPFGDPPLKDHYQALNCLGEIAHRFFPHEVINNKESDGLDFICKKLEIALEDFLKCGVLVKCGGSPGDYLFLHLTFQEYLTGRHLAQREQENDGERKKVRELLDRKSWDPWWHEVMICYAGMTKNPESLMTLLLKKSRDDLLRHRARLAFDCLPEVTLDLQNFDLPYKAAKKLLRHFFPPIQTSAADALGFLSRSHPGALQTLLEALKDNKWSLDENENIQRAADSALNHLSGLHTETIHVLLVGLKNENSKVRKNAARILGNMFGSHPEVVQALLKTLKDENWVIRHAALDGLGRLSGSHPEVVQALLKALKDENWPVQCGALRGLGYLSDSHPEAVQALLEALKDENWVIRHAALDGLGRLPGSHPEQLRILLMALKDKNEHVRLSTVRALSHLSRSHPEAMHALLDVLKNDSYFVRIKATKALGQLSDPPPEAVKALLDALSDEEVSGTAVLALDNLSISRPEMMPALLRNLESESWKIRDACAGALGRLSRAYPEAFHALLGTMKDGSEYAITSAARALGHLSNSYLEVKPALLEALKDERWGVRAQVASVLSHWSGSHSEEVKILLGLLKDKDGSINQDTIDALGNLFCSHPDVVKTLLHALTDGSLYIRGSAAVALGKLSISNPRVEKALVHALTDGEESVRACAVFALGHLSNSYLEVKPALLKSLKDKHYDVRISTIRAFGNLSYSNPDAMRVLLEALKIHGKDPILWWLNLFREPFILWKWEMDVQKAAIDALEKSPYRAFKNGTVIHFKELSEIQKTRGRIKKLPYILTAIVGVIAVICWIMVLLNKPEPFLKIEKPAINQPLEIGKPIKASGTHSYPDNARFWVVLIDVYGNFYLQHPPVRIESNGTWEARNIMPDKEIVEMCVIHVTKKGDQHFQQKADKREWDGFTSLPQGSAATTCQSIDVRGRPKKINFNGDVALSNEILDADGNKIDTNRAPFIIRVKGKATGIGQHFLYLVVQDAKPIYVQPPANLGKGVEGDFDEKGYLGEMNIIDSSKIYHVFAVVTDHEIGRPHEIINEKKIIYRSNSISLRRTRN